MTLLFDFVSATLLQNLKAVGETFKSLGPETVDRLAKTVLDVVEINKLLREDVQLLTNESALWREIVLSFWLPFVLLVSSIALISIACILRTTVDSCRPHRLKNE